MFVFVTHPKLATLCLLIGTPMTFKSRTSTVTLPSDVVFEPYSELKTEEGAETLVLHIPDFRRDQLRVQVNNLGVLKVSGEKLLGENSKRKSHFLKETKIPQGCDINDIRAKFIAGKLHVIMPIRIPTPENQQKSPSTTPSSIIQSEAAQDPKINALGSDEQKQKGVSSENGSLTGKDMSNDNVFGIRNSNARLQVRKKVAVNWGVAVVALVAIGAYVAYAYGSSTSPSPPSHNEE